MIRKAPRRLRSHWVYRGQDPLILIPYLGVGNSQRLLLGGRVLRDEGISPATKADRMFDNLLNFYRRLETDEVPGARVQACFQGVKQEVVTDRKGYFHVEIEPVRKLKPQPWQQVKLELLDPVPRSGRPLGETAQVLAPPPTARFGVISDIDDTVLVTNVTNKLHMMLTVALLNARTRLPFKGVACFYKALQHGRSGDENNPIFYVSSSPWNLYDMLLEFFDIHGIPIGPLFLRRLSVRKLLNSNQHHEHKLTQIETILNLYPHLPFILIGDSGEQDPEIYRQVVHDFPDRIRAIYIRNVTPNPARLAAIDALVEEVRPTGCQLVLTPDSEFAAAHAAAEGFIATQSLPEVRSDKEADEQATEATELLTV